MNKWHMLCFCDAAGRREERRSGTMSFRICGEEKTHFYRISKKTMNCCDIGNIT